jgi:hypothetical protein
MCTGWEHVGITYDNNTTATNSTVDIIAVNTGIVYDTRPDCSITTIVVTVINSIASIYSTNFNLNITKTTKSNRQ